MAGSVATKVMAASHKQDPKTVIWDALKDWLHKIEPTSGDVVICVYERPTTIKMKNALGVEVEFDIGATSRATEDKFQGVVGLIVKTGPLYDAHLDKLGLEKMPPIGSWVAFRTQDCTPFVLGERSMRLMQGNYIRLVLQDPDCII